MKKSLNKQTLKQWSDALKQRDQTTDKPQVHIIESKPEPRVSLVDIATEMAANSDFDTALMLDIRKTMEETVYKSDDEPTIVTK